jgi:hypothetical protein
VFLCLSDWRNRHATFWIKTLFAEKKAGYGVACEGSVALESFTRIT